MTHEKEALKGHSKGSSKNETLKGGHQKESLNGAIKIIH